MERRVIYYIFLFIVLYVCIAAVYRIYPIARHMNEAAQIHLSTHREIQQEEINKQFRGGGGGCMCPDALLSQIYSYTYYTGF